MADSLINDINGWIARKYDPNFTGDATLDQLVRGSFHTPAKSSRAPVIEEEGIVYTEDSLTGKTVVELKRILSSHRLKLAGNKADLIERLVNKLHGRTPETSSAKSTPTVVNGDYDDNYQNMKVKELKELLKARQQKVTGTKPVLIDRLRNPGTDISTKGSTRSNKAARAKSVAAAKSKIVDAALEQKEDATIEVSLNGKGLYVWSGLVFDQATYNVIGSELPDGTLGTLTLEGIKLCNESGLKYDLPEELQPENVDDDNGDDLDGLDELDDDLEDEEI